MPGPTETIAYSGSCDLTVGLTSAFLPAKIGIILAADKDIPATIDVVPPHADAPARLRVVHNVAGPMTQPAFSGPVSLDGVPEGGVAASAFAPARLYIDAYAPYPGVLRSSVRVLQTASAVAPAQVEVIYIAVPSDIRAQIDVKLGGGCSLPARIYVFGNAERDLPASLRVRSYYEAADPPADLRGVITVIKAVAYLPSCINIAARVTIRARITVLPIFVPAAIRVLRRSSGDVPASVNVLVDRPGPVTPITVDVPGEAWTNQPLRHFAWRAARWAVYPVAEYAYTLSRDPAAQPGPDWSTLPPSTTSLTVDFRDVGSDHWYLLVAARNTRGHYGPVGSAEVRYNLPPTQPGVTLMKVNGQDTLSRQPLIAGVGEPPLFTWSAASDEDPSVTVKYQLQVASRSDFQPDPATGRTSVVVDVADLTETHRQLGENLPAKIYFWRIRAFDDKQFSDWSQTGSFRVNARPSQPYGLAVSQMV